MADQNGMHGHLSPEARARRKTKNDRNRSRVLVILNNGTSGKAACNSYDSCNHAKHQRVRGTQKH